MCFLIGVIVRKHTLWLDRVNDRLWLERGVILFVLLDAQQNLNRMPNFLYEVFWANKSKMVSFLLELFVCEIFDLQWDKFTWELLLKGIELSRQGKGTRVTSLPQCGLLGIRILH